MLQPRCHVWIGFIYSFYFTLKLYQFGPLILKKKLHAKLSHKLLSITHNFKTFVYLLFINIISIRFTLGALNWSRVLVLVRFSKILKSFAVDLTSWATDDDIFSSEFWSRKLESQSREFNVPTTHYPVKNYLEVLCS